MSLQEDKVCEQPCDYVKNDRNEILIPIDVFDVIMRRCVDDDIRYQLHLAKERWLKDN